MQDRGDKKLKCIWITPEENKNWNAKNIHRFLELSKNDQARALNIYDLVLIDNTIIKVHIP